MRLWLGIAALVVLVVVLVSAVQRSERKEAEVRFQNTLSTYRAAVKSGSTREQVESYLHQQNTSFTRSCCEPGVFSDRADLGDEPRNLFCQPWKVSAEFQFKNAEPPADAAKGSDLLTNIDLHREGVCF
jgi:hypothetical protein